MARLLTILLLIVCFTATSCNDTQPTFKRSWVNDEEHIFTPAQVSTFDSIITANEKVSTNEIAIATLNVPDSVNTDTFATQLFNKWKIGKKNKNNGVLILLYPQKRKIVIRNGFGIEPIMSDEATKQIIDELMIPEYRKGHYFEGTLAGLRAIIKKIR